MTESDLFRYVNAKGVYRREKEHLKEIEDTLRQAPSPQISPLPFSGNSGEDRIPSLTCKLIEQQERVEEARKRVESADELLTYVSSLLDYESQRDFLHYHYRLNYNYSVISKKRLRSIRSLHRDRLRILERVKNITYITV